MCESCGKLINITDIYPDGECGYYYVELTIPSAAITLQVDNGEIDNLGGGNYKIYDVLCGETVTITLINDQSCVSATEVVTYNCCGTECNIQTVTIDTATCDGNRIYSITSENGLCDLVNGYAIVDSSDPNFTSRWDNIADDIYDTIKNNPTCEAVNECCTFGDLEVSWDNDGDDVTIYIENSPVKFTTLTIVGIPCAGDISFEHTQC